MNKRQFALIVLDGWGYREEKENNAIAQAKKPFFDYLWQEYPHTLIEASGPAVGLPEGQIGGSEVGHLTIGAGKILDQELVRINKSIKNGEFDKNKICEKLFSHVKKNNSTLHVMGLVSPGGIHSHIDHLFAFLKIAKESGVKEVAIHAFTDGRDVPPKSASRYLEQLENLLEELKIGRIATVSGRFYSMDRDDNWDRLEKAEKAIFEGQGNICKGKLSEYLDDLYKEDKSDEYLEPIVRLDENGHSSYIKKHDGVFFFNLRADRARMLSRKIIGKIKDDDLCFVTMTDYGIAGNDLVAFPPIKIKTTLAKEISLVGLTQAHIAETTKYAHATYFLNGGVENPYEGEENILVPSRNDVPTYDLAPRMSASGIADEAVLQIKKGTDFIFINFANADMVGHTANMSAIIEAVEEIDKQLKRVIEALLENNGIAIITADHGNAEVNVDEKSGEGHTAHTMNKVPFILTNKEYKLSQEGGTLADITPTIFQILEIKKPESMTGESLIK
ncbi:MAG: 2,3-bisphosphoglycerate-independent phosphoglycerate mutase [Candidatus Pacebacteria bacterium]|nr:2,3-bisphosphoglycerate-independent phosphoglycerate mutase [Candidatus Paceibacterota bacterium]